MSWVEEQSWFGLEPDDFDLINDELEEVRKTRFLKKGLWTTSTNRFIHITEMTERHIMCCINKCIRENWRVWALPMLEKEIYKRRKSC